MAANGHSPRGGRHLLSVRPGTERKQSEADVRRSEECLRALVDAVSDEALVTVDLAATSRAGTLGLSAYTATARRRSWAAASLGRNRAALTPAIASGRRKLTMVGERGLEPRTPGPPD